MSRLLATLLLAVALCGFWTGTSPAADTPARFGGIGAQVVPTVTGELVVLGVLPQSPANRSGLRPGDMIVEVDDFPLRGSNFREVVNERLWGEAGSVVRLRYLRPGQLGSHLLQVERVELRPDKDSLPGVQLLHPGEMGRDQ